METDSDVQSGFDSSTGRAMPSPVAMKTDSSLVPLISKSEVVVSDVSTLPDDKSTSEESPAILDQTLEKGRSLAVQAISDVPGSPIHVEQELETFTPLEATGNDSVDVSMSETDHSSAVSSALVSEESAHELPLPPLFIDLTDEQRKSLSALAVARITESYKVTRATGYTHERLCLLARLVSQVEAFSPISSVWICICVESFTGEFGTVVCVNLMLETRPKNTFHSLEPFSYVSLLVLASQRT